MRIASLAAVLLSASCTSSDPRLLESAQSYESFGRVDGTRRWAPTDCKAPLPDPPRMSASRDSETHGRKLYHLYAKNREAYRLIHEFPQPVGQVVVKESWIPAAGSTFAKPVTGDRGPLFIMMKTGEPDSDDGWIYTTAAPDGSKITSWGKLASCMECHLSAKHDRLFGLTSCAAAK